MAVDSTTAPVGAAPAEPEDRITPDLLKLAGVIILGTFAVQMDGTMVNVALSTLRTDFGATVATIQWVTTAYLLSLAMVFPLAGWAVDRFGSKPTWMFGLTAFLGGSALCAIAWSPDSLTLFRVLQGLGGGILLPLSQTILAQAAGEKRMGRLMAIVGIPFLLGPVLGPVVGGAVVQFLDWRWIFAINIPLGLIALLVSWQTMPASKPSRGARLDTLGLLLLSPALAGLIFGMSMASKNGQQLQPHTLVPLIGGAVLLGLFIRHALRTRGEPIIDVRLFTRRDFASSSLMLFFAIVALLGSMLLLPLYYQIVTGASALRAGLLLAPLGLGAAVGIALGGKLTDRFSPRPVAVAGVLLAVLGLLPYTQIGGSPNTLWFSLALLLTGIGFGMACIPATVAAYRGMAHDAMPRATAAIRIFQQVGGSFGVAVLALFLQIQLSDSVYQLIGDRQIPDIVGHAFGKVFWLALGFTALALPFALLMPGGDAKAAAAAPAQDPGRPVHVEL